MPDLAWIICQNFAKIDLTGDDGTTFSPPETRFAPRKKLLRDHLTVPLLPYGTLGVGELHPSYKRPQLSGAVKSFFRTKYDTVEDLSEALQPSDSLGATFGSFIPMARLFEEQLTSQEGVSLNVWGIVSIDQKAYTIHADNVPVPGKYADGDELLIGGMFAGLAPLTGEAVSYIAAERVLEKPLQDNRARAEAIMKHVFQAEPGEIVWKDGTMPHFRSDKNGFRAIARINGSFSVPWSHPLARELVLEWHEDPLQATFAYGTVAHLAGFDQIVPRQQAYHDRAESFGAPGKPLQSTPFQSAMSATLAPHLDLYQLGQPVGGDIFSYGDHCAVSIRQNRGTNSHQVVPTSRQLRREQQARPLSL